MLTLLFVNFKGNAVTHLEVLEHVPSLGTVEGEHEASRHEGGLDVSELQLVQG